MIDHFIFNPISNYIGAAIRFSVGTTVRKLFGLKTYTFTECLNGPEELPYIRYNNRHQRNNRLIGAVFIMAFFIFISYIFMEAEPHRIRTY